MIIKVAKLVRLQCSLSGVVVHRRCVLLVDCPRVRNLTVKETEIRVTCVLMTFSSAAECCESVMSQSLSNKVHHVWQR